MINIVQKKQINYGSKRTPENLTEATNEFDTATLKLGIEFENNLHKNKCETYVQLILNSIFR